MMRTEDDLRAACEYLEHGAPELDDVLAAVTGYDPHRHSPRRRYFAVGGTVAAVAAVAVAVVGLTGPSHHASHPPPAPPRAVAADPALSQVDFTVVPPPHYEVVAYDSGHLFQRVSLATAGSGRMATVTLYRPGGYDGAITGRPTTVNGRPGVILTDAHPTWVDYLATDPSLHARAVLWQYTAGAWAMATGSGGTPSAIDQANLALARSIRPGTTPVRVPFKLSYLPAGLAGSSAETSRRTGRPASDLSFKDATPAGSPLSKAPWGSAMDILASSGHVDYGTGFGCPSHPRTVTVGADTGCYLTDHGATSGLLIELHGNTVRLLLDAGHYGKYSDAELVRILAGMTFAPNVDDQTTWFPGGSALP
jgi:hypothetical protein